jgi:hypothetical protein
VVKAIFSVTKITEVEQVDLSASDMQLNEVNIQDVTTIQGPKTAPTQKNSNPLFMNPRNAPKSNPN